MTKKRLSPLNIFLISLCCLFVLLFIMTLKELKKEEDAFFLTADFSVFYVTAAGALEGKEIYHPKNFKKTIIKERNGKGAVRYLYAPFSILIFFPLLIFDHDTAVIVWGAFNILLIAISIFCSLLLIQKQKSLKHYTLYLGMIVFFGPLYKVIVTGQVNILIASLLLLYLLALQKNKVWHGGIFLASMVWLKIFPIVLILYHIIKKQWKIVYTTSVTLIVTLLFSLLFFGIETHTNFLGLASKITTEGIHADNIARKSNATLNGVLHTYYLPNATTDAALEKKEQHITIIRYSIVFLLGCMLLLWTYKNARTKNDVVIEIGAWLSFVFFAAADIHIQYFVLLLPFFFIHLFHTPAFKKETFARVLIGVSYILIALSETSLIHIPYLRIPFPIAFVGNTLFFMTVVWYSYTFRKKSSLLLEAKK